MRAIEAEVKAMNVSLTRHFERLVQEKVESGRYHSASEVIRDALRLLEERDRMNEAKLEVLRADIREGLESGPAEEMDMNAIKERARRESEDVKR